MTAFAEASYGRTYSAFDILPTFDFGTIVIRRENAFLPESLRQAMVREGVGELRVGRLNTDFGYARTATENVTRRGVLGLEGRLVGGWNWSAYGQYGETKIVGGFRNSRLQRRFADAVDAVIDPATGNAVCRSSLADPANGCVPLNIFGHGSPQPAALAWIHADQRLVSQISQTAAAIAVTGQPFSTWAGPVSVAFGAEYRREEIAESVDALTAAGAFTLGNPTPINGSIEVREAYGELVVPIAAEQSWARALDLNLAVRLADYALSGAELTWKLGLSWAVNRQLRLRVTRSRDIRAPNIGELFSQTQTIFRTVNDPVTGNQLTIRMLRGGNPDLRAERADTLTAGIIYEPDWLPGLHGSVDAYDISIEGAVGAIEAQDIINRCAAGASQLCGLIQRDAAGQIETVRATSINLSRLNTRGVDLELGYRASLAAWGLPGLLRLRLLGTYVDRLVTDDGIVAVDRAGDLGPFLGGVPHWRWNAAAAWEVGPTTAQVQGRFVGGGAYDHTYGDLGISDNTVSGRFYVDASIQHDFIAGADGTAQLFLTVNNLFNRAPPVAPDSVFVPLATNKQIFDVVGRYVSIGARFRF